MNLLLSAVSQRSFSLAALWVFIKTLGRLSSLIEIYDPGQKQYFVPRRLPHSHGNVKVPFRNLRAEPVSCNILVLILVLSPPPSM